MRNTFLDACCLTFRPGVQREVSLPGSGAEVAMTSRTRSNLTTSG